MKSEGSMENPSRHYGRVQCVFSPPVHSLPYLYFLTQGCWMGLRLGEAPHLCESIIKKVWCQVNHWRLIDPNRCGLVECLGDLLACFAFVKFFASWDANSSIPMSAGPMYRPHGLWLKRNPHPGQEPFSDALLQSQHMDSFWKKYPPKRRRKYSQATGNVKIFQKMDATASLTGLAR